MMLLVIAFFYFFAGPKTALFGSHIANETCQAVNPCRDGCCWHTLYSGFREEEDVFRGRFELAQRYSIKDRAVTAVARPLDPAAHGYGERKGKIAKDLVCPLLVCTDCARSLPHFVPFLFFSVQFVC